MSAPAAAPARGRRVGRLERAAIAGVMSRELTVFRHYWPSTTFSSIVQPTIYLLAFGLGFGALVSRIGGVSYVQFVGTGTVATAVLFSSAFPGMFGGFVRRKFQRESGEFRQHRASDGATSRAPAANEPRPLRLKPTMRGVATVSAADARLTL